MSSATITASAKTRVVSDRQPDSAPTLHVAFLSEDGGRAAQCAAHLTRGLANDALEVEAAGFDDADVVLPQDDAGASLTIVLHTLGAPAPILVENSGGRIDWYLEPDPVGVTPVNLALQLWQRVVRLLDDLGIEIARSAAHLMRPGYRTLRLDPSRPFFRWCQPVTAAAVG